MIDELKLSESQATAIIEKAIEFEVYSDEMPDNKKDKIEAAHEVVAFAIDSWVDDGIRPDADDEDQAKAGKMVEKILNMAGVVIDDDDNIEYGDPEDADDGDSEPDGEAPFDIDDVIEGYAELTAATKIKKIKALELDPDDDDDYNTLVGIEEWENAQDEPSSRVLNYLGEVLPEEADGEAESDDEPEAGEEPEGEEDGEGEDEPYTEEELNDMDKDALKEVAAEFDVEFPTRLTDKGRAKVVASILEAQEADEEGEDEGDNDGDTDEEPWEGYDDASIKDIKEGLAAAQEDDEEPLTAEQVQYVLEYEKANENRKSLVSHLEELYTELNESEDDAEGDEPEDEPEEDEKPKRSRGRAKTKDPDDDGDADDAKAKDDRKDARKGKGGTLIITQAQILEALTKGEVEIELG